MAAAPVLVWFRDDLRLDEGSPLIDAGHPSQQVGHRPCPRQTDVVGAEHRHRGRRVERFLAHPRRGDDDPLVGGVEELLLLGDPFLQYRDPVLRLRGLVEHLQVGKRLVGQRREMIGMLFYSDPPMPYRDVARQLGLAVGSIGFIRGRCLRKLQKLLESAGLI